MQGSKLIWSVMLGSAMLIGCDSDTETPSGAEATNTQATEEAADQMADSTENASERVKDIAEEASGEMEEQAETASDTLKETADEAANAANANPAAAQANAQLKAINDMLINRNVDGADAALQKLEANKASMPQAVQTQIDAMRKSVNAAKAGAAAEPSEATPAAE